MYVLYIVYTNRLVKRLEVSPEKRMKLRDNIIQRHRYELGWWRNWYSPNGRWFKEKALQVENEKMPLHIHLCSKDFFAKLKGSPNHQFWRSRWSSHCQSHNVWLLGISEYLKPKPPKPLQCSSEVAATCYRLGSMFRLMMVGHHLWLTWQEKLVWQTACWDHCLTYLTKRYKKSTLKRYKWHIGIDILHF